MGGKGYYPFGMQMPVRSFAVNTGYRYGFNGKENDNETGNDNYDYGARIYDGRLGRWLSVDPLAGEMPSWSPYNYCFDNPLRFTDADGRKPNDWVELNGVVFWDSRATNQYKTTLLYGGKAIHHAPNTFGYDTPKGYVLLAENRHWIRNAQQFTAPEHAPKGIDYNKVNAVEAELKFINSNSDNTKDNYVNTWGDRTNICTSGILMPKDGNLRWGAFEASVSLDTKGLGYGTVSGSVVYTDSKEGGVFYSVGGGVKTNPDKGSSFNFNIYQNTNPYDNYIHFKDFAGVQDNNSLSIPVPQAKSNVNINWGKGSTYNYFGIGRSSLGIPGYSRSQTYTPQEGMRQIKDNKITPVKD